MAGSDKQSSSCNRCCLSVAVAALLVIFFAGVLVFVVVSFETPRKKPHIVFVLVDDVGFNDVSWNNKNEDKIYMPTLHRMATNGNILDFNYMQSVCTPSRGVLMTGRYAHKIGMSHRVIRNQHARCAPKEEKFVSEALKDFGYSTHLVGKWHLGYCAVECTPLYRGFDSFYGFYGGFIDSFTKKWSGGYDFWFNNQVENVTGYATDLYTKRSVDIIQGHDSKTPLFLFLSHGAPHIPLQAPEKYMDLIADDIVGDRRTYLAMLAGVDYSVTEVEKALKEKHMWDNTIIIFSSDNGGEWPTASNSPLRGGKGGVYEGGNRVPAFVHSPLIDKKGVRNQGMIHVSDWYPTLLAMAKGTVEKNIDGVNQYDMLMDNGKSKRHDMVYHIDTYQPTYGRAAVRKGDYKLIVGYTGRYDGWETDGNNNETYLVDLLSGGTWNEPYTHVPKSKYDFDWDYIYRYADHVKDVVQLYNIKGDPEERVNLAKLRPEKVKELMEMLHKSEAQSAKLNLTQFVDMPIGHHSLYNGTWTPGWCDSY